MHYYTGKNAMAIAVEGNFDDCQNLVKKVFTSDIKLNNLEFSSANSINIGRLVPQIIYYFYSYLEMVRKEEIKYGEKINYVVPTGNFGNILACYIAKKMGLFIDKIVCASNENSVLTDFFNNKVYDKNREFYLTNSPAMDILISSNLERLLYLITNNDEKLVNELMMDLKNKGIYQLPVEYHNELNDFYAYSVNPKDTVEYIKEVYTKYDYLIDPHTAVAYGAYTKYQNILKGKTVVVSTASPFKFLETVDLVFNTNKDGLEAVEAIANEAKLDVPSILYDIYNSKFNKVVWTKENMEENLRKLIGVIDENC
jgi:threonine synthase